MQYRVISEAKPCFEFESDDKEEAESVALRVAVITARTAYVQEFDGRCMTCTQPITDDNPRNGNGTTCLSCGEQAVDDILDADEREGIQR